MDQPQHGDGQEHNEEVNETSSNQEHVSENQSQEQPTEQGQSVPITVVNSADTESSIEHVGQPIEASPEIDQATASDELANVANELAAMSPEPETPVVDEGLPGQSEAQQEISPPLSMGTDPMDQIQADEAAANAEGMAVPTDFASGEQANEMDAILAPVEEPSTVPFEETPAPAGDQGHMSTEPMSEAPAPLAEEPSSNSEAVNMANEALLEQEPTRNPGDLISDVIAPTAVAAAVAGGTSGENAITGTPETSSVESAQAAATAPKPAKQKSNKGKLILIVIIVVLLFGGAAVAAYLLQSKKDADSKASADTKTTTAQSDTKAETTTNLATATPATTTTPSQTSTPGETVSAKALDDYKAACGGGMVTNATDFKGAGPHPVVFFEKGSDDKYAMSIVAFKDKTWAADATKVTSGQLAVCVSEKTATEKKIKTCSITDPATKVTSNVDYYSASYAVDVYNAKTGAKVNSYESPSIVTECPTTAVYDKTNPKIVAKYDLVSVEALIKPDVTKAL